MIAPEYIDPSTLRALPLASRRQFPETTCIYFAIDSLGAVQYIGQSVNLRQRWAGHHRREHLEGLGGVRIAWIEISDRAFLNEIESALIDWFDPPLNSTRYRAVEPSSSVIITVKKLREQRKWSQNDLARKTGYSLQFIQKIEQGKAKSLTLDAAERFCEAFGCEPGDLLARESETPAEPQSTRKQGKSKSTDAPASMNISWQVIA